MLKIGETELDFDITSPSDVLRYKQAGEQMEQEGADISAPSLSPDDPGFIDAYVEMLNAMLRHYGNFLDRAFGDGTAQQLMGSNPSLSRVNEVIDALAEAMETQGREFGVRLKKYQPNRASRRRRPQ